MDPDIRDEQAAFRRPVLSFLQGDTDVFEGNVVIGFGLVVEVMDQEGRRDLKVVSSDAGGTPQSWYMKRALALAMEDEPECDDQHYHEDEDDDED